MLVLVRSGPRISKYCWIWSGPNRPVYGFQISVDLIRYEIFKISWSGFGSWIPDLSNSEIINDFRTVVLWMTNESIGLDFLSRLVINGTSDGIVGGFSAVGSSRKGGSGQDGTTTEVTSGLER